MCLRDKRANQGFTLIEILTAVAILGISLVTIVGLQIKTIRLQQISNRTTVASLLAAEIMSKKMMEISDTDSPSLYFDEGDFEEDGENEYPDYHWEYTLSTLPMADDLYRIDLMVFWGDPEDKEEHSVTLASFVMGGT